MNLPLLRIVHLVDPSGMSFQDDCNTILDNPDIFEEDKIDRLEELVSSRFPSFSSKDVEKKIMDILWKHKDPSRNETKVVKIENRVVHIDIAEIEKKIELESQSKKLDTISDVDKEYYSVVQKIKMLNFELYGDPRKRQGLPESPIEKISAIFNNSIPRSRIEQSLKVHGYNVVEACRDIIKQLTQNRDEKPSHDAQRPLFSLSESIPKAKLCLYLLNTGQCLRSDCPFSHDLSQRVCHFWLKGNCIAGEGCSFKHAIDEIESFNDSPSTTELATSMPRANAASSITEPDISMTTLPATPSSVSPTAYKPIVIQLPLKKPKLVPWEENNSRIFKKYVDARNSATRNEALRKKYASQSTQEWRKNNGEKSKKLSGKANNFGDKTLDDLKQADDELYEYSETTKDELWFEMHGLEYNEAIDQLQSNLKAARSKEHQGKLVYLVVPSPTDFNGMKKITKPIQIYLDQDGYRWEIFNYNSSYGSIIVIDPS